MDNTAARQLSDVLWRRSNRYRGMLDVNEFGDVLLVLLYLRGRPAWGVLVDGGVDVERVILADVSADGEDPAIVRPLLDSVRKVLDARQLAPLIDLVAQLYSDAEPSVAQVFSALLDGMSQSAGRMGGEFHTPDAITELAVALLDPAPGDRILDPCCKAGGFPAAIIDRLIRQDKTGSQLTVAISDYSERSCALAYLNLRLRGVTPQVLLNPSRSLPTGAPDNRYDVVTANPPFNISHWTGDNELGGRWPYGVPPAHNGNYAWLQYAIASLNRGGRAAVVMPHGAGLSENSHEQSIRAAMLEDGVVSAVIALPGQLFASTDIPVTLWLLQPASSEWPGEVLFIDATTLGSVRQRGRRTLASPDIDKIVDIYRDWHQRRRYSVEGLAIGIPLEEIRAGGYRLNPRAYIAPTTEALDPQTRARQVGELMQRLNRLAEQAVRVDRTIEAHLKELSL
jgi:type I restriction enzyme M protein